ncbi:MAG: 30S ribosomal protein S5 [Nanoarchaeota archaeon]|nr:30S ribosomal protein S5 [Nanoarchaeota archaeon]MBU1321370.1 30S ribosomal protein S5 [Nanoarchaeota archaeon]MBU1597362.1 30S ribosomal protein S5 [Nanoarchaeota archaeon]MBU2441277.1 30S ribosomal protein S5 [Nanoarchaeota archaeon]
MVKRKRANGNKDNESASQKAPRNRGSSRNSRKTQRPTEQNKSDVSNWKPKTELGRKVQNKEITNIDEVLDNAFIILEPEVVDSLLDLEQDLLLIGQSKGKFGGGARRVFRQTQKKTREGNKPKFSTMAIVGDKNTHVGIGFGKAKETVPAREKAIRKAKLNIFKIRRGCGSWQCGCGKPHSLPVAVEGKCGSVEIILMPAPKGKGLCCEKEVAKILEIAGIKDVWSKTRGQTKNRINMILACEKALRKTIQIKIQPDQFKALGICNEEPKQEKQQDMQPEILPEAAEVKTEDKDNNNKKTKE